MALSATLQETIKYSGLPTDKRGLLPIAKARQILKGASKYPGAHVHESDDAGEAKDIVKSHEIHAALVSLETADEALGHLTRLEWGLPLYDATTLVERYGEAVLPWFAGGRTSEGNLELKTYEIEPALVMLGSEAAFDLVLKVRAFHHIDEPGRHPIADLTKIPDLDAKARIDILVENTIDAFIAKHPQVVARVLAKRPPKDKRTKALVKRLASTKAGKAAIDAVLGPLPVEPLTTKAILAILDQAAGQPEPQAWPKFSTGIEDDPMGYEYFGLRLIAARSKKGEAWGVVLERISGSFSPWEPTRVERFTFGSNVDGGKGFVLSEHPIVFKLDRIPDHQNGESLDTDLEGVVVTGPAGKAKLSNALIKKHDLRAGCGCELEGDAGYNLRLRAYLAVHPGAFWAPAKTVVKDLEIADAEVIVESAAFTHVVGATYKKLKATSTWRGLPSKSKTYQSLADALVNRNAKLFIPGKSNLDVGLHAVHKI